MADHTSIHPSESLPFPTMYRFQTQGQKSSHYLFQNNSIGRSSQYGDSINLLCEPANSCANPGTSINGADEQVSSAYWGMETSVSSQPLVMNKTKAHHGVYEEEWNSNSQQIDAMDDYGATDGNHQKLDSFSEAFYGRSLCRITSSSEEQAEYNTVPNNASPPLPSLSFPLVLSPPPTPLPPSSLSPPKRAPHPLATQTMDQAQSQSSSESPLRFFPPLPCSNSILPGSFTSVHWLPLSTDTSGSGDLSQHLPQDPSPSSIYTESLGLNIRQLNATHRDTDCTPCSNDISPCSPMAQNPQTQSIPKLANHNTANSDDHMTWPQTVQSSQTFCSTLHLPHPQTEGHKVDENIKPSSVLQQPHFLCLSTSKNTPSAIYTGVPFHSILQSEILRDEYWQTIPHYTPPPMLSPTRSGTGLFCKLLSHLDNRSLWSEERDHYAHQRPCVNIGPDFQAELPDVLETEEHDQWSDEPLWEELLWKPWRELEESDVLQEHVENLLDLSTSTALPGGGANVELGLHSLYLCKGNIMAALEMMFFPNSALSRDNHYAGSNVWRSSEQKLFHKAFSMYGKDFALIQKMVKTKQISQCVEFYYNSKHLQEKQRKQKERNKQQQQMDAERTFNSNNQVMMPAKLLINPVNMERLIHTPSLATSFPCKQCGKMFYKIKSRNAHMKIHRQQQEDWRERIHSNSHNLTQALQNQSRTLTHPNQLVTTNHQNQLLTQNLIQNLVQSQAQLALFQNKTQSACFTTAISSMTPTQIPQNTSKAPTLPLYTGHQQAWGALHGNLESSLYYN